MAQKGKKQVLFLGCQVTKQYVNNKTPRKCCNRKNYFKFFFIFQSSLSCYRETAASSIFRFEKRSYRFTFDWYKDIGDSFQKRLNISSQKTATIQRVFVNWSTDPSCEIPYPIKQVYSLPKRNKAINLFLNKSSNQSKLHSEHTISRHSWTQG